MALIALALGWRESIVVGVAVPVTLALTLLVYWLFGYTLNRVTLFALIFSIGILVDDAIVVVENIHRHLMLRRLPAADAAVHAVDEVGNPTILATFTVIAAILPMAFVSGLMGPYMRPIPVGRLVRHADLARRGLHRLAVAGLPAAAPRSGARPAGAAPPGPTRWRGLYRRIMTAAAAAVRFCAGSSWPGWSRCSSARWRSSRSSSSR